MSFCKYLANFARLKMVAINLLNTAFNSTKAFAYKDEKLSNSYSKLISSFNSLV